MDALNATLMLVNLAVLVFQFRKEWQTRHPVALRRAVSATMAANRAALALYNEPKDEGDIQK